MFVSISGVKPFSRAWSASQSSVMAANGTLATTTDSLDVEVTLNGDVGVPL